MGKKRITGLPSKTVHGVVSAASDAARNALSEWSITIILLLFGTTTLLQAFVIPSGSMENTLLAGDHILTDKLA